MRIDVSAELNENIRPKNFFHRRQKKIEGFFCPERGTSVQLIHTSRSTHKMLLRNGKEYIHYYKKGDFLTVDYTVTYYPDHLQKYCHECVSNPWLCCKMCGVETCSEHGHVLEIEPGACDCCHQDYCGKCMRIIAERKNGKCDDCNYDCEGLERCHSGMDCDSDCGLSECSDNE